MSYGGVVLHDGVVQLLPFGGAPGEEARLADVHVELFEAAVPAGSHRGADINTTAG